MSQSKLEFDDYAQLKAEQIAEGMGFFNGGFRQHEPKSAFIAGAKWQFERDKLAHAQLMEAAEALAEALRMAAFDFETRGLWRASEAYRKQIANWESFKKAGGK